jgi:hypothetical protein
LKVEPLAEASLVLVLSTLLVMGIAANAVVVSAYSPRKGDSFSYTETITVNNGQGSYSGYTDQTMVGGTEQVDSVNGSVVSASYSFSYQYSNSQESSTSHLSSGSFTWSSANFTYLNGTDDQVGYSQPIYVWFAMGTSVPVGGTFDSLNTQFTVLSKNYSLQLPTEGNRYVQTIEAEGTGKYQRSDSYGVFNASYTWYEYFDPATGYIVGYNYIEQDNGQYQGQAGSFTYTDDLYVTSTSYNLAQASPGSNTQTTTTTPTGTGTTPYVYYAVALLAVLVVVVVVYAATRRGRKSEPLPKHSQYVPPPPTAEESRVDLGSKPPEQVVIKEVAMVNCKFCGTLIPTTTQTCPHCGAPRQ